jgi:DNA-binding NarL/FixJ family response regulator
MAETEILIICTHDEILKTIVRLIDSNSTMCATGASTLEQALTLFKSKSFDLVLIGAGLKQKEEEELISNVNRSFVKVPIIRHYGGGSGLLFTEIFQALGK